MSKIEWTERTWNPVRGCSRVSPGCDHCYAMGQAHRFDAPDKPYEGLTRRRKSDGAVDWSGRVRFVPEQLDVPLRRKKPTVYFVNSMSDLFHDGLTNEQIAAVFGVMAACPQHTFQVLTKRAERMRRWVEWATAPGAASTPIRMGLFAHDHIKDERINGCHGEHIAPWPLPNVWLGVSAEDQQRADERIPRLLATPAAVRFVSAEPLLGPLDLSGWLESAVQGGDWPLNDRGWFRRLDWVIVGGESGPKARPCLLDWIDVVVAQCRYAGVPVFVKQIGSRPFLGSRALLDVKNRKGGDPSEWPGALRVRQMPEVTA